MMISGWVVTVGEALLERYKDFISLIKQPPKGNAKGLGNGLFGNSGAKSSLVGTQPQKGGLKDNGSSSAANQGGVKTSQNFNQGSEIPDRRKKYL